VLSAVERLLEFVTELGGNAAYLSQAELVLPGEHPWVKQAQTARKEILDEVGARLRATSPTAPSPTSRLLQLKKSYLTAYIAQHSKARLGDIVNSGVWLV